MTRRISAQTPQAIAAEVAVLAHAAWSDAAIARDAGLGHNTVIRARRRLEDDGRLPRRITAARAQAEREGTPGAVWRPVAGWEDCYEISDYGDLRNIRTGLVLKKRLQTQKNYVMYELRSDGVVKPMYAHRLVAQAFLGDPTGPLVRHLDDVKTNNHVSNLSYGDHIDNAMDAIRNGLMEGRIRAR